MRPSFMKRRGNFHMLDGSPDEGQVTDNAFSYCQLDDAQEAAEMNIARGVRRTSGYGGESLGRR